MSLLSALDPAALQVLRAKLEGITDVEAAVIDESAAAICLVCDPQSRAQPILADAQQALASVGLDQSAISMDTVVRTSGVGRHRVRFLGVERIVDQTRVRIKVSLEWRGDVHVGEATGENGDMIELRTAACAALGALEKVVGEPLGVRVVGVKQVRAFDTDLMVVSLHRSGGTPQRLVGAVPGTRDARCSAAVAVLNGLNRIVGNYLNVG